MPGMPGAVPPSPATKLGVQPALGAADATGKSPFLSRLAAVRCAVRGAASIISRAGGPASAARAAKMRSNTLADDTVVERLGRHAGAGAILQIARFPQ